MRRFSLSLEQRRGIKGYAFISPFLIGFVMFFLYPFIHSVILSFHTVDIQRESGYGLIWEGLENYRYMFRVDPDYNRHLVASIQNMFLNVPIILIFSFFAATLLNQKFRGRTLARAILFLPVIISSGVVMRFQDDPNALRSLLEAGLSVDPSTGAQTGLRSFELSLLLNQMLPPEMTPYVSYITGAVDRIYDLVNASGVQILVFLAALQSIPPSMFEASYIEGATGWENFWKITFPMISSWFLVNTVYSIVDTFTAYSNPMMIKLQRVGLEQQQYGRASAMAWVYFAIIMLLMGIILKLMSKRVFYYE